MDPKKFRYAVIGVSIMGFILVGFQSYFQSESNTSIRSFVAWNTVGVIYEIIGFIIMLAATKKSYVIPKTNLGINEEGDIRISTLSYENVWQIGIIFVVLGLIMQLMGIGVEHSLYVETLGQ